MSALILGGAVVGAGGYIAGSGMSSSASKDATRANMADAQRNRDFQERMSNTAYQRQMRDLQAAGLNPMLVMGGSGASQPSGSTGSAVMDPSGQMAAEGISRTMSSALEMRRLKKELDQTDSMIKLQEAQAEKAKAEQKLTNVSAKNAAIQTPALRAEAGSREATASWDKWAAGYDAIANRVMGGIGGVTSAIGRIFKPGPSPGLRGHSDSSFKQSYDRMVEKSGRRGVDVPKRRLP